MRSQCVRWVLSWKLQGWQARARTRPGACSAGALRHSRTIRATEDASDDGLIEGIPVSGRGRLWGTARRRQPKNRDGDVEEETVPGGREWTEDCPQNWQNELRKQEDWGNRGQRRGCRSGPSPGRNHKAARSRGIRLTFGNHAALAGQRFDPHAVFLYAGPEAEGCGRAAAIFPASHLTGRLSPIRCRSHLAGPPPRQGVVNPHLLNSSCSSIHRGRNPPRGAGKVTTLLPNRAFPRLPVRRRSPRCPAAKVSRFRRLTIAPFLMKTHPTLNRRSP